MAHVDQRPVQRQRHPSRTPPLTSPTDAGYIEPEKARLKAAQDEVMVAFIKRVLCSRHNQSAPLTNLTVRNIDTRPLDDLLPPLTSSNEVDIQLYACIAAILHQFVQSWYNKITPDDDFISEIVQIIAHCTRGIEERLRHINLEHLLLDEVPGLLDDHLVAIRVARASRVATHENIGTIYHTLRPHAALVPIPNDESTILDQQENESAWCQSHVDRAVSLMLPPEDLANPCLNVLVQEIFSEMIMRNAICGKASEPWLLWEGVVKVIHAMRPKPQLPKLKTPSPINRLEQFGLVTSNDAPSEPKSHDARRRATNAVTELFWSTLQFVVVAYMLLRAFAMALMHASSIPTRRDRHGSNQLPDMLDELSERSDVQPKPVVQMRVWTCLGHLTTIQQRMPWLSGLLSLFQWLSLNGPGQVCRTNTALDRLMSAEILQKILNPTLLPAVLQATRSAIFPNNALAPARVPPTSDEIVDIKRNCARAIVELIPEPMRKVYFATGDVDEARKDIEETLELFADAYINKHLVVALVDLLIVRLFPETGIPQSTG